MKKLFLLLVLLVPLITFSQSNVETSNDNDLVENNMEPNNVGDFFKWKYFSLSEIIKDFNGEELTSTELEIEFIRFCRAKEYQQRKTAYLLGFGSAVLGGASIYFTDIEAKKGYHDKPSELPKITRYGSVGLGVVSAYIFLNSEKWNKYSSIKPSREGLGVVITF